MFFYVTLLRPPPASCSLPSTSSGPSTSNGKAQHKAKASDKVSKSKNSDKSGKSKGAGKAGPTSGIVNICPEISNDLRYENLNEPAGRDIYYSWIKCGDSGNPLAQPATWPAKLTTYRADTSSRYKELPVPVPREAKHGDRWRLALWCEPAGQPKARPPSAPKVVIELCSTSLGAWPLPVMSEPVVFDGVPTEKQVLVSRVYSLGRVEKRETEDVLLTITERTGYNLATKVWDSGVGLSSWISGLVDSHPDSELETQMRHILLSPGKRRIVELGAGTGILSFTLAALRQALRRKRLQEMVAAEGTEGLGTTEREEDDEIFVTDLESALDLLNHNLRQNIHLFEAPPIPTESEAPSAELKERTPAGLHALELNWDKPDLPDAIARGGALDLVMMADVTYNSDSFPELVSTMESLIALSPASTPPPMFLLGYKQRHPDERVLWDMAEKQAGLHFVKVAERRGYARPAEELTGRGEGPVEIWIGTVQRQHRA